MKYLGLKYVDHGRDLSGVDCWGLVFLFYRDEFGVNLPSWSADYECSDNAAYERMAENKEHFNEWRETKKPKYGDVCLFSTAGNFHVGLYLDKCNFLHIMKGSEVTIERFDCMRWRNRFRGWWTYVGC